MKCEYCDQPIDASAEKCPYCGAPTKMIQTNKTINNNITGTPMMQNQSIQTVVNQNTNMPTMNTTNNQMPNNNGNKNKIILIVVIAVLITLILSVGLICILVFANKKVNETKQNVTIGIESDNPNYNDANYQFGNNIVTNNSSNGTYTYSSTTKVSTTKYGETTKKTTTAVSTASTTIAATTHVVTTANSITTTKYVNSNNDQSNNKTIKRTIMMYVVGADLESKYQEASKDIKELYDSKLDDNTEVIAYLGGAKSWGLNIDASKNTYLRITNKDIQVIGQTENYNMGDATTLSSFITNAQKFSPNADKYDLILWNHGAGFEGYGLDEVSDDLLYLPEIVSALEATNFKGNNKFEFIGFDACIMNTLEVLSYISNYANYAIASEELESGLGWNYYAFANASKLNTEQLGKQIIDSFAEDNAEYDKYVSTAYTLSMIDLSKMDALVSEINKDFSNLTSSIKTNYESIAKARAGTIEFGKESDSASYDQVDIIHLIQNLNISELNDIIPLVKDAVVYSNANLTNANGLAIEFPYTSTGKTLTGMLSYYSYLKDFEGYYNFIKEFSNIKNGTSRSITTLDSEDVKYANNTVSVNLDDTELSNYYKAYYVVFKKDGEYYQPIYKGTNFKVNNNKLEADYDKKALYVTDNEGNSVPLMLAEVQKTNRGSMCITPVMLQSWDDSGDLSTMLDSFKMESGWLKGMLHDDTFDSLEIVPIDTTEDELSVTKGGINLKDWKVLQFTTFSYKVLDENNKYTTNWESSGTVKGIEVKPNEEEYSLEMKPIDDGEYFMVTTLIDFQGNRTHSDFIQIQ